MHLRGGSPSLREKQADRPLVGVSCCRREIAGANFHTVADAYLDALADVSACEIVLVPALGDERSGGRADLHRLIGMFDGLLLTGARSMVSPALYGGAPLAPGTPLDAARDATTLPLVRHAIERQVPLFAICRGFQELCCALGGRLEQDLSAGEQRLDHRAPTECRDADKYLPRHLVRCSSGGRLSQMATAGGLSGDLVVNSLHRQGVRDVGPDLTIEARSDDGLVEAAHVSSSAVFALGVQWHPEWHHDLMPINRLLFEAFGADCRAAMARRRGGDKARGRR